MKNNFVPQTLDALAKETIKEKIDSKIEQKLHEQGADKALSVFEKIKNLKSSPKNDGGVLY